MLLRSLKFQVTTGNEIPAQKCKRGKIINELKCEKSVNSADMLLVECNIIPTPDKLIN
jgi:hypothetical protein